MGFVNRIELTFVFLILSSLLVLSATFVGVYAAPTATISPPEHEVMSDSVGLTTGSLVLGVAGLVLAVFAVMSVLLHQNKMSNRQRGSRWGVIGWLVLISILGFVGFVFFMVTGFRTMAVGLVSIWTFVNAGIFIVQLVAVFRLFKHQKII